jgi:hypothetical protein
MADFVVAEEENMPVVAPDKWNLAGVGITVFYSTTAPGLFHYVDIHGAKTFTGPQIRVVPVPDLGTLVSVTLNVSPIAETTFTVLLPALLLDPPVFPVSPVHTEGITTLHHLFPPFGQKEFYTVTPLNGSASL